MDHDSSVTKVDKLTSDKYHIWKQRIIHVLTLKDLDQFIEEEQRTDGDDESRIDWQRKDRNAQAIIGLSISNDLLENVRNCDSAKEMWSAVTDVFERHTLHNKLAVRREFYTAIENQRESILHFSNRVRQLADTLKSMDVMIDDSEMAMSLLNALSDQYHALIRAVDVLGDEDSALSFDHVNARVIQEEQRIGMRNPKSAAESESAVLVSYQSFVSPPRPQCTYWKKLGHNEDKCWKKHPHLNPHKKHDTDQAAIAISTEEDFSGVICLLTNHQNSKMDDHWFLDSGCGNNITHNKSLFHCSIVSFFQ